MSSMAETRANQHKCIELPAFPMSVSIARKHVMRVLAEWGCEELINDAQLVTSELVTNGIKAVQPNEIVREEEVETLGMFAGWDRHVRVGLHRRLDGVVVEVWDPSREPPRVGHPDVSEVGGRGLQVVEMTAAQWGYRWLKTGGKVVWAVLELREGTGSGG
ncbi:ATP-binding protein [Nonomuraea sp. NPDC050451]|uniref:ATP-binding protein n=1 Tax=Nonomuraea sp. NPDC050451 TaxID=3364364 RepID=UPI0037BD46B8